MPIQPQVDVNDFVNVSVNISPTAIPYSLFGLPMVLGDSNVITTGERYRSYTTLLGVANDFGTSAPEYLASAIYFGQEPQPAKILIGRWASSATNGELLGATLAPNQQLLANFTAITDGSMQISIDGSARSFSNINLSAALNLNGVASIIQTALRVSFSGVSVLWDANNDRFTITSGTTGPASSVSYSSQIAVLGATTDISTLMGWTAASGASPLVVGMVAETPLAAAQAAANASSQWYGLAFAATGTIQTSDHLAIAAFILASTRNRIYGVNIQNTACMDPTQTTDLASELQLVNNKRIFWMYSSSTPYPVMTMMGRAFTVDFNGNNTTITLAYKQAPGVNPEYLTETQFATIVAKGGNVNIAVDNGAAMIWPGQMANGYFFDETHNVDWFANRVQTDVFNLMYQTTTKVPQTDDGNHLIATTIEGSCAAAVNNGMSAPGVWNASGFGSLRQGMALNKGFYVYYPLIAQQSQSDREARKSVPFQIALKLAGAVHTSNVIVNVNR